jgi:hypothetical protein
MPLTGLHSYNSFLVERQADPLGKDRALRMYCRRIIFFSCHEMTGGTSVVQNHRRMKIILYIKAYYRYCQGLCSCGILTFHKPSLERSWSYSHTVARRQIPSGYDKLETPLRLDQVK